MTQRVRSPVLGYNHNLRHGGRVFHVQTEDSGAGYARLYTHLFFEGTILASKKQEYEPGISEDDVRGLMQKLHKSMIKELTHGGHDPRIAAFFTARGEPPVIEAGVTSTAVEAVVAHAQPELPAPAPAAVAAPISASTPAAKPRPPAPKPVVMVKPGAVRRPPVVLGSSADGVVVQRNVVINVGGGEPPVNGTAGAARPRAAAPYAVRDGAYVTGTSAAPASRVPVAAVPEAAPQPLASSREIRMPWETPGPARVIEPPVVVAAQEPVATTTGTRLVRMPWDPPPPPDGDAFASARVSDKGLDEVILEYLSDDIENEER